MVQQQQEELSRRREERSSLQEQCKHLEARRRHADRYTHTHTLSTTISSVTFALVV